MGKLLKALANNELNTIEIVVTRSQERQKLLDKNQKFYNELVQKLNDEEKNLLEKLLDVISDESYSDIQENFMRGYCLGSMMTTEIFSKQDSFFNT